MTVTPSFSGVAQTNRRPGTSSAKTKGTPSATRWSYSRRILAANNAAAPPESSGVGCRTRRTGVSDVDESIFPPSFSFLNPDVRLFVPLYLQRQGLGRGSAVWSGSAGGCAAARAGRDARAGAAQVDALNAQFIEHTGPLEGRRSLKQDTQPGRRVRGRSGA